MRRFGLPSKNLKNMFVGYVLLKQNAVNTVNIQW